MLPHHVQDLHLTGCCRNCRTAPCLASGPSVAGVSAALPAPEPLDLPNLRPASAEGSKGQHSALHNRRPSSGGGASLLSPPLHLALQSPLPRPPMPGSGAVWGRTWQSSKHWFQLGCGLNDWMFANFNACALPPPPRSPACRWKRQPRQPVQPLQRCPWLAQPSAGRAMAQQHPRHAAQPAVPQWPSIPWLRRSAAAAAGR